MNQSKLNDVLTRISSVHEDFELIDLYGLDDYHDVRQYRNDVIEALDGLKETVTIRGEEEE